MTARATPLETGHAANLLLALAALCLRLAEMIPQPPNGLALHPMSLICVRAYLVFDFCEPHVLDDLTTRSLVSSFLRCNA